MEAVRLALPCEDAERWSFVRSVLERPLRRLEDLDEMLGEFAREQEEPRECAFFSSVPGSGEEGCFDFGAFLEAGAPLLLRVALEMETLFAAQPLSFRKTRSGAHRAVLSRRQCACLLAHSFLGSLRRPPGIERNDFRFRVSDLFQGSAASPNSAVTFLNYFNVLARTGIPEESVTFERRAFSRHSDPPWTWDGNEKPLCSVQLADGSIDDCAADLHVEFSNCFVGGGVLTGDAAMEELLFLVKPELMVAMVLQGRMEDEEAILVHGARKYSVISGYGQGFEFAGDCSDEKTPSVCAIDAIRGGGHALSRIAMLRDMNKARLAFEGASIVATGHWGCGAYGNNYDLMMLKQWLAASEAGAKKLVYHDFSRAQSHSIFALVRRLKHLTVGGLWEFLNEITQDIRKPHNISEFCSRIARIATGKLQAPL